MIERDTKAISDIAKPHVSVLIPCRNEETFIAKCLDSIVKNSYPKHLLEVLVIDGMSKDETRTIVMRYIQQFPFVQLLNNPAEITPAALNIGIGQAKGEIIVRMDAHCIYPDYYIERLIAWRNKMRADNVGGVCQTIPANESIKAKAIAIGLSHPFGVGNSYFRIGTKNPRWVDTVPFGCYSKSVFDCIGYFDESLVKNQDDEFNLRLLKHGGRILLVPDIVIQYYTRASIRSLAGMYYQYGYFKPLVVKKTGGILTVRQMVPPIFVFSLLFTGLLAVVSPMMAYLLGSLVSMYSLSVISWSTIISLRNDIRFFLALCAVFSCIHLSYGVGYIFGAFHLFIRYPKKTH